MGYEKDFLAVVERLHSVERTIRWQRTVRLCLLLLLGGLIAMGHSTSTPKITATKFVLIDSHGRPRITIGTPASSGVAVQMQPDDPAIWISDERGNDRVIITMDGLRLADSLGRPR